MARKSRKTADTTAKIPKLESSYIMTAIYARLSIENSGKDDDGDSIENQITFCEDYLQNHPELKLYNIYKDNGEKGTNFDRPEFQRLMDDVKSGKVKCIIVKDLSRFGRNYIETGEYLEKIFPFFGVRFISVTDQYDSDTSASAEEVLMVPLKNMINEVYAKDISRKIITSFRARQANGEFLPSIAPYGYVKSKTKMYRYEIDEAVADNIRLIYKWKAEGIRQLEIRRRLNAMGATTPTMRKVELGIWKAEKHKSTHWSNRTITDILINPIYTGCIVYGRISKSLYEGIEMHRAPKEEWRILPNMHEAIISQELFDKVQDVFEKNKAERAQKMKETKDQREQAENLFENKIYCGICGKRMRLKKGFNRKKQLYLLYECAGFIDSNGRECSRHGIIYKKVCKAVMSAVTEQITIATNMKEVLQQLKNNPTYKSISEKYVGKISYVTAELTKVQIRREQLYENLIEGILDEAEYQLAKEKYSQKAQKLSSELDELEKKQKQLKDTLLFETDWARAITQVENMSELTQKLVDLLVECVYVYEDKRVEVKFNYAESRNEMYLTIEELLKEETENG